MEDVEGLVVVMRNLCVVFEWLYWVVMYILVGGFDLWVVVKG